ncbi:DUF397 domain-containing protein [Streptomyces sp. NPDC050619]|uniref:DUF397 domain-containing protein n=1 Tax=Streptomyces sp. NPDC050619 TaxID=3157214 RepID=UPI00342EFD3C
MSVQWQKSSFSGVEAENCVELAHHKGQILIRESDIPDIVIAVTAARLRALLGALKAKP